MAKPRKSISRNFVPYLTPQVDTGKIWVVVTDISEYDSVRTLKYADKDATAFQDYFLQ